MLGSELTKKDLIIAAMIGEGYIDTFTSNHQLIIPFKRDKSYYLYNLLKDNSYKEEIKFEPRRGQFKVDIKEDRQLIDSWYENGQKIFKKEHALKHLSFMAIVTAINLFGERKIEGISVPSNISEEYIKTLSYCIQRNLNITVISGKSCIKIPEVTNLFLETYQYLDTFNSTELLNFLTKAEKNKLLEVSTRKSEALYV